MTELCKRAELNRGTFYLHYLDLNDVLDDIFTELLSQTTASWTMFSARSGNARRILFAIKYGRRIGIRFCSWTIPLRSI